MTTSTTEEQKESLKETIKDSQRLLVDGVTNSSLTLESQSILKKTYQDIFYRILPERSKRKGQIMGFPMMKGNWCTGELKIQNLMPSTVNEVQI